eukprot:gene13476-16481_t
MDTAAEALGAAVFVSEGTTQGNQVWLMTTDAPITIGTTALVWTQVGAGASYTAGNGISISGGVIAVDTSVVARKMSATIGDGTATTITVTHNLNTQDVTVSVRESATNAGVITDWVANGVNTVQLTFGTAPTSGQYRATDQVAPMLVRQTIYSTGGSSTTWTRATGTTRIEVEVWGGGGSGGNGSNGGTSSF